MADNVGNLAVVMTLNNEQFNAGLREATANMQQMTVQVQQVSASMSRTTAVVTAGAGRQASALASIGPIFQSLSFGAQDFASQLGTRGVGGALQAASNNIQMLGAFAGPWGMAISAAAGVAVQGLGVYLEMQDRIAKKSKETARVTVDAWKEATKASNEQIREIARARAEFMGGLGFDKSTNFDDANPKDLESRIAKGDRRQAELDARRNEVLRTFDRNVKSRFGDITAGERPSSFFGLDVTGARALDVGRRLKDTGFKLSAGTIASLQSVDRELRAIDAEGNRIYEEGKALTDALFGAIKKANDNTQKDLDDKTRLEQLKRQETLRSAVTSEISVTSEIQRRRDQVNEAFRAGAITQLEKTVAENRISRDEVAARQSISGPKALTRDSDEVFAAMQRALRGEPGAADKQESIKKNTADTASATKETAKAVKKLTDRPVVVVRF